MEFNNAFSLEDLECDLCKKFLTIPPIYYIDGVGNICGRCIEFFRKQIKEDNKFHRQTLFESVASHLYFPCVNYKFGCDISTKWEEVFEHEDQCKFAAKCPLSYHDLFKRSNCTWNGDSGKFINHLEKAHTNLILNPIDINLKLNREQHRIYFSRFGDELLIIIFKCISENKFGVLVLKNENPSKNHTYNYHLELMNETKENSILLRKNAVYNSSSFVKSFNNPDEMLLINLEHLKDLLKLKEHIKMRITIDQVNETNIINTYALENPIFNRSLLEEVRCPSCTKFMVPPIIYCEFGHSVCLDCRKKEAKCPLCEGRLRNARNYMLENLTKQLNYPCKNKELGCSFMSNSIHVREHEANCALVRKKCIVPTCVWFGFESFHVFHLQDVHSDKLIAERSIQRLDLKERFPYSRNFLCYDKQIFWFYLRVLEERIKFQVYSMKNTRVKNKESRYNYIFEFVNQEYPDIFMGVPGVCYSTQHIEENGYRNIHSISIKELKKFNITDASIAYFRIKLFKQDAV